uniref:C3H1-type domain-containing protein n=1 Tax=Octactis speculum TaxID=3111310 RepID=A0A7S2D368_9STRA|mmetsp:Transcript_42837/g.58490  ORF Transcript_42837/g.58490 Transcript_42837/m.58490 type:complete len:346 (+) Transcript_42837:82-1119(+)
MEGNNKSVPPPISMGESFSLTGRPQGVTWKHGCPVSVAFTCEDQLIVGTKSGAVALMSGSVLSERLGVFGVLSHAFIVDLVSFLQYEDAQVLREVCRLFHDTTKRMRDAWCLHPLRPNQLAYVKQLFVNWSRLPDGQKVSHTAALDASGAPVCRDWMRDGECSHPYCPLSHSPPVVDLDLLETTAVVELNHGLYGAVSELFGAKWWWEREAQIRPLFHHYATAAVKSAQHPQEDRTAHALLEPIDRCDRSIHERAVEVVRERAVMVTSQVLRLDAFVAVMTVLMETKLHLVELREHVSLRAIHPSRAVRNRRTRIRGEHLNPLEAHLDIVNYQTSRCVAAINALF